VAQLKGILTTRRYTVSTVFVDHFSDLSYVHFSSLELSRPSPPSTLLNAMHRHTASLSSIIIVTTVVLQRMSSSSQSKTPISVLVSVQSTNMQRTVRRRRGSGICRIPLAPFCCMPKRGFQNQDSTKHYHTYLGPGHRSIQRSSIPSDVSYQPRSCILGGFSFPRMLIHDHLNGTFLELPLSCHL